LGGAVRGAAEKGDDVWVFQASEETGLLVQEGRLPRCRPMQDLEGDARAVRRPGPVNLAAPAAAQPFSNLPHDRQYLIT
jgi:hypothetical protein